jgi:hypothetical protein
MTPPLASLFTRSAHEALRVASVNLRKMERACSELALAIYSPSLAASLMPHYSKRDRSYAAAGYQELGLYPFEQRILARFFPKPPARVFVPGAGSGREAKVLLSLGYRVDAIEPAHLLCEAARHFIGPCQGFRIEQVSVQEWSTSASEIYDAVLGGWTLWTHLLQRGERVAVLRALARACPRGPIVLSFWRQENGADPFEGTHTAASRVQTFARRWIRERFLGLAPVELGTDWNEGLFAHWVHEHELEDEASAAGLKVVFYERDVGRHPCAVLTAKVKAPARKRPRHPKPRSVPTPA